MKLYFRKFGKGKPLIVLHGLFGFSSNWQSIAKFFSERYEVYLLDQRNHGQSPHSEIFNYDVMVNDVLEFMELEKIENPHILGHSMGGKVAMKLAGMYPQKVDKIVVGDIAPKRYVPDYQHIFNGFKHVNLSMIKTRREADEQLSKYIPDIDVRQFLLKNLYKNQKGNYQWNLNIDAIEKSIEIISDEIVLKTPVSNELLFIIGTKSNYINEKDYEKIKQLFPNAKFKTLDTGHWVHAENPQLFSQLVFEFLV